MIGSNTLAVKEHNKFRVHIWGGLLGNTSFEELEKAEKKWGKPDAENLTAEDAFHILSSHQCNSEFEKDYSKFAGDIVLLLDLDAKKMVKRDDFVKQWEAAHSKKLESLKKEFIKKRRNKTKNIFQVYEQFEREILKTMKERQHEDLNLSGRDYNQPDVRYDGKDKAIDFFVGHANQLKGFDFAEWFLKRRENLTVLVKRWDGWRKIAWPTTYTFTHNGIKWLWDYRNEHEFCEFIN